ncbi:hypothetical protein MBUL_04504 (plasmid) [Methylobacterium bullatum]|uniref:Uncharacterized protein n=1 Tax=Methylobacterium bullatum TaxID=570505 RepID=A0A679JJ46_9HYPH|nr:hypothetical protein MBUL_04504 [Methylobacterium bullatum]
MAYFNHAIRGDQLDLAHLEPLPLTFYVRNLGRDLTIDVKFSNHCFTVDFDATIHDETLLIMDHKRRRAYDLERHTLSRNLPGMIASLPAAAVYLTPSDRNYVYLANFQAADKQLYPMYFHLRRAHPEAPRNLSMFVESAYPVMDRNEVMKGTTKISFAVLCAKVYKGEPVKPLARR